MGFDLMGSELRDDKEPIKGEACDSVGNGLESERSEFAFHDLNR